MLQQAQQEVKKEQILGNGIYHEPARPMKVVVDKDGCVWLCDKPVDETKPFSEQSCWNCKDMIFTRND